MQKAILEADFRVPAEYVPLEALSDFKKTIKDREGNPINFEFFQYKPECNMYCFARGNIPLLRKHFQFVEWEDIRSRVPMAVSNYTSPAGSGLEFRGSLKPHQLTVANEVIKNYDYGVIEAPPRFGKTILLVYLTCHWRQKTLFLSHQHDLSEQVYKSFVKFTNVIDLEYYLGKPVVGIVEKWSDIDKLDVVIMNYQKFVSGKNADQMLLKFKNSFGVTFIDEVHRATADRYSSVVVNFNSSKRIGVSATPERKSKVHVVNEFTVGPVVVKGEAEQVPATAVVVRTKEVLTLKPGKLFFTLALNYLSKSTNRNRLILKYLKTYADAGYYVIAVTDRTKHCEFLASKMRDYGITAEAFHSKLFKTPQAREQCLQRCRRGETQVIIAMRSMVLGLDLPRFGAFFNLLPTANGPNYYQEFSRARTPFEGKNHAYLVDFVDNNHILEGCYTAREKVYTAHNIAVTYSDF